MKVTVYLKKCSTDDLEHLLPGQGEECGHKGGLTS